MKVTIVGAGPAGLYAALLLKRSDPSREVTVNERNAPDATFGWGVVFSEETLGALRDADESTYLEITDTFARWDAIDVTVGGHTLRSRGHGFSAIRRTRLLTILQERCRHLGVELRFGVEIDDAAGLANTCDLLVAADGVNSGVRQARATAFGTRLAAQGCKYVWFGTDLVFDAFRFIFAETEEGMFQVHGYPFDERASTFIVECPAPVWRRAGLDTMTDAESLTFCEKLFAEELNGHHLISNRSTWLDFQRVHNRTWHDGNIVIIGDAAHTAHFTIGSGTKLAMEDSIALVSAVNRYTTGRRSTSGDALEAALVDFELERQPMVERFQRAADDSADYFTRVGRHASMAPHQFAFNLLTRSGRIGHANLAQRDADFVRRVDAELSTPLGGERRVAPPPAFTPFALAGVTFPNRVVRVAASSDEFRAAASDGAGVVLSAPVAVTLDGRASPNSPTLHDEGATARWAAAVELAHAASTKTGIVLGHAGSRGSCRDASTGADIPLDSAGAWPLVAASAIRYAPYGQTPRVATEADMAAVRDAFVAAAERATAAGFDLVGIDCAHGGLLAGFLSPLTNHRTDAFGGDAENRVRFPASVVAAVRAAWPHERPLVVRLTVDDWAPGGLTPYDGVELAAVLKAAGATIVQVEAGQSVLASRPVYGRGYLTTLSDRVRSEVGVSTLVGGWITTIDEIDTAVAAGRADLCVLELPTAPPAEQLDEKLVR